MNRLSHFQKKLNRIYSPHKENLYSHRFFLDICSGYSFILGNNKGDDFYSFEPPKCEMERLLNGTNYYFSHTIEQRVSELISDIIQYGKAYIYIRPEYKVHKEKDGQNLETLFGIILEVVKGFVLQNHDKTIFYEKGYDGQVKERILSNNELIIFDIKKLGFRKNYFMKMVKKLGSVDMTSSSLMLTGKVKGYDFLDHYNKYRIKELKVTKDIGWAFRINELSESYILYKKIQQNKLKIKILNYVIERINEGISTYLQNEDVGKLVANIKDIQYDQCWNDFKNGKISITELSKILFSE